MAPLRERSAADRVGVGGTHGAGCEREKSDFWEYDTAGSRVITDLSTNAACGCLTSQIGRDAVLSPKCGRTQRRGESRVSRLGRGKKWAKKIGPFRGLIQRFSVC